AGLPSSTPPDASPSDARRPLPPSSERTEFRDGLVPLAHSQPTRFHARQLPPVPVQSLDENAGPRLHVLRVASTVHIPVPARGPAASLPAARARIQDAHGS